MKESSSSTYSDINRYCSYLKNKKIFLYNNKNFFITRETNLIILNNFFQKNKLQNVDNLNIDTESYEFFSKRFR